MSTSYLQTGNWSRPALTVVQVLGEDPRAIMRRAVLQGLATPPARPLTAAERNAAKRYARTKPLTPRAKPNTLTPEERRERDNRSKRDSKRRARAALAARGLTELGVPRKRKANP